MPSSSAFQNPVGKHLIKFKKTDTRMTSTGVASGVFRTLSKIYDYIFCENSERLKAVTYYCQKTLSEMLNMILNTSLVALVVYYIDFA